MANDHMMNEVAADKVFIFSKGISQQIQDPNIAQRIVDEASRLFIEADDIYWKAVTQSTLNKFREQGCVEIIYATPRKMVIQAVKETKIISMLLIPIDDIMCSHDAHIVYGDPDYDSFNLLLNSQGCSKLQKLIQELQIAK